MTEPSPQPIAAVEPASTPQSEPADQYGLVLLIWLLATISALGILYYYSRNVPIMEDWEVVPVLAGEVDSFSHWLWSQTNEHRIPLPRLITISVAKATGFQIQWMHYLNTLLLSISAAALIWAARQTRGRSVWVDGIYPILLLHPGNVQNFLWGFQITFVSSITLSTFLLTLVTTHAIRRPLGVWVAASLNILLPFCGAYGIAFATPMSAWFALLWVSLYRERRHVFSLLAAGLGALVPPLIIIAYFIGYQSPKWTLPPTLPQWIGGALEFLSNTLAVVPQLSILLACLVLILVITTCIVLVDKALQLPQERLRIAGLLLFLSGFAALAAGTSYGRVTTIGCLNSRYITLMAPLFATLVLASEIYHIQFPLRPLANRALSTMIVALVLLFLPYNTWQGIQEAEKRKQIGDFFLQEVANKRSIQELAESQTERLLFSRTDLEKKLALLAKLQPERFKENLK